MIGWTSLMNSCELCFYYKNNIIPSVVSILSYFRAVMLDIVTAELADMRWCFLQ